MNATTRPRILVTGSREWENQFLIHNVLTSLYWMMPNGQDIVLVSGKCARGADAMCEATARHLGWQIEEHPAEWQTFGRRAGFTRNSEMVAGGADMCLAFILNESKGATMTANLAEKAGIETLRFKRWTLNGLSKSNPAETGDPERSDPDILRSVERLERGDRLFEGARL